MKNTNKATSGKVVSNVTFADNKNNIVCFSKPTQKLTDADLNYSELCPKPFNMAIVYFTDNTYFVYHPSNTQANA